MPTDTDKTLNGTPEPFRRSVVWGRPPATVFRVGPLPKGGGQPPLPGPPRMRPTPGVLTGSMIPRAAPTPTPRLDPPVTRGPEPAATGAAATAPEPDLTLRPLPTAGPILQAAPSSTYAPAQPASIPVAPASAVRKSTSRVPLYAGIALAAVTVLALGGWIWTRSSAGTPPATAVAAPAPEVIAPPPAATSAPLIGIVPAPVPGPAATLAERPSTDPDAPVATRPQPVG